MHYKNVHRYGETNIRHVDKPLRPEQWKKNARGRQDGRPLPDTPRRELNQEPYQRVTALRQQRLQKQAPVVASSGEESIESQAHPRVTRPVKADFFISVPIFNETMTHSYRRKNEYVYVEQDEDTASLLQHSLSRSSSNRDLRRDRPPSGASHERSRRRVKSRNTNLSHRPHSHDGRAYYTREYDPRDREYVNHREARSLERRRYDDREREYVNHREARSLERRHYESREGEFMNHTDARLNRSFEGRPRTARGRDGSERGEYEGRLGNRQSSRSERRQYSSHRQNYMSNDKPSRNGYGQPRPLSMRKKNLSSYGSEASLYTQASSTATNHSYIHEEMPPAYRMRKAPSSNGLIIDSDNEDPR